MGMRKYQREIARNRIRVTGAGNVNRKMGAMNKEGVPLWRRIIFGDLAKDAEAFQLRGNKNSRNIRRIKKVIA